MSEENKMSVGEIKQKKKDLWGEGEEEALKRFFSQWGKKKT